MKLKDLKKDSGVRSSENLSENCNTDPRSIYKGSTRDKSEAFSIFKAQKNLENFCFELLFT